MTTTDQPQGGQPITIPDPKSPLNRALAAAQAEVRDPTRSKSGQVRGRTDYTYAGLDDLLEAVRPVFARHGIAIAQPIVHRDGKPFIVSQLRHESGEVLESSWELRNGGTPQDRGSEITYARRYTLEGLTGVAATADDDGREASDRTGGDRNDNRNEGRDDGSREQRQEPQGVQYDEDAVVRQLAPFGLTLDEANWWSASRTRSGLPLHKLEPVPLAKALGFFLSEDGAGQVKAGLEEIRAELQRCFFAKWTLLYPTPLKKDGASDEDRERAEARSESDRKAVMKRWYGVESVKVIPIRQALKGDRSIGWLRDVPVNEFESAVLETLRAVQDAA